MRQYHHQCTTQCYLRWDHPREYGENSARCPLEQTHAGPSPRIRGKCSTPPNTADEPGTIPANTGKIGSGSPLPARPGDHPREYGENDDAGIGGLTALGPSPRIRGKCRSRISLCFSFWDHPREYGENRWKMKQMFTGMGPSPRIRGKCEQQSAYRHPHGTIPANTGRMRLPFTATSLVTDHPREYGENNS